LDWGFLQLESIAHSTQGLLELAFAEALNVKAFLGKIPDLNIVIIEEPRVVGFGRNSTTGLIPISDDTVESRRLLRVRSFVVTNVIDLLHGGELELSRPHRDLFFTADVDAAGVVLEVPVLLALSITAKHLGLDLSLVGLVSEAGNQNLLSINFVINAILIMFFSF